MDKRKLIQIIKKELEEIKVLSEEIAEDENDTSLIIELAISKSRLLCQEFELLRDITAKDTAIPAVDLTEENEVDEDEVSDISISDPELEIVNFEEQETDEVPESDDEDEVLSNLDDENEDDDFKEPEFDSEDLEEEGSELDEDDLTDNEDQEEIEEEYIEEEIEEEGLIEFGDHNTDFEEIEIEKPVQTQEHTELKTDQQPGVREIIVDDMDDDDLEPIKNATVSNVADRPVMREIPKPEELFQENPVLGEPLPKDRSLNDSIGETKLAEPLLTSGPIPSLRAAIGLNDRFLFIREIFANNTDKYNRVIDQLDKLETQQQAVELLKANITLQKNETSMKFVDLLKRRFSK